MSVHTKQEVDRLLEEAHKIMMEVSHIDVTQEEKKEAKNKCSVLYRQIELLDPYTYELLTKSFDNGGL
jgi:DNA-binding transcriptional regulator GbsR (MarR family)